MDEAALPWVDEHARDVRAAPERAWAALTAVLPRAFGGAAAAAYARAVGCEPGAARGVFPQEGSALAGFRVARVDAPRELVLAGSHRFSRYELVFALDALEGGGATRVRARTSAVFPGATGRAYRVAVIGSGAHGILVRRMLRAVARRAEGRRG